MVWESRQESPSSDATLGPVPRRKLPPQLQKLVDHDDGFYDDVYSPYSVNSTDTSYRYAAYANRIRTLLLSAHRYVAYTSDIGESFRPVAHPYLVRSAYAISWTYLLGDVGHEGYKAYLRNRRALAPAGEAYKDAKDLTQEEVLKGMATGDLTTGNNSRPSEYADGNLMPWKTTGIPLIEDYRVVMAKRAVFQGLASMALPAFTIHSVVKYSGRMMKNYKSTLLRTWAPIGIGLSVVPLLPYIFDEPLDEAVEYGFRAAIGSYFGQDAIKSLPTDHEKDSTSLSHFLDSQNPEAIPVSSATDGLSWEEYREERQRAKEQRRQERAEKGSSGPVAMLKELVGAGEKKKGD
ncbi:mitochondrial fission process 1 family protein [Aspergillus chevalieri]|uniref:Mitochondrial fission process protein 1 n=1 Tax=Aspergillus chevalieri TaxID=182096 RepID=A0A7R7VLX7_ASPCH|nr:uncharacterized protein ACHE_31120S [Aspergillus chevalieri]BCR87133.1 hypothetical protein ACHE_31120S [Aspergillus chevalieri]